MQARTALEIYMTHCKSQGQFDWQMRQNLELENDEFRGFARENALYLNRNRHHGFTHRFNEFQRHFQAGVDAAAAAR